MFLTKEVLRKEGFFCLGCGKKLTEIVRLFEDIRNDNRIVPTQTIAKVCENKNCVISVNLEKVKTWRKTGK